MSAWSIVKCFVLLVVTLELTSGQVTNGTVAEDDVAAATGVPAAPGNATATFVDVTTAAGGVPATPGGVPTAPSDATTAPVDVTTALGGVPTAPSGVPAAPVDATTAPVEATTAPGETDDDASAVTDAGGAGGDTQPVTTTLRTVVVTTGEQAQAPPDKAACTLDEAERVDCGWAGVTDEMCRAKGCCWQPSATPNAPWCHRPKASHDILYPECALEAHARADCGWAGINADQCVSSGCCWRASQLPGPWCYHKDRLSTRAATTSADAVTQSREKTTRPQIPAKVTTATSAPVTTPTPPPGEVLSVTSVFAAPYLMNASDLTEQTQGNARYQGFIPDLLDAMLTHMKEYGSYQITLSEGNQYGKLENGRWTGMIGEVMAGNAEVAAAPLTVTLDREKVVDFTYPIGRYEAAIVLRRREEARKPVIKSLEDLMNQEEVEYGVARGGLVANYLVDSKDPVHELMWEYMNNNSHVFKSSNNHGIQRARQDHSYAFILEGPVAEYVVANEPCDLEHIKAGFLGRQYAMAVANRSPLRDVLNEAILRVQSDGTFDQIRARWFGDQCPSGSPWRMRVSLSGLWVSLLAVWVARWFISY